VILIKAESKATLEETHPDYKRRQKFKPRLPKVEEEENNRIYMQSKERIKATFEQETFRAPPIKNITFEEKKDMRSMITFKKVVTKRHTMQTFKSLQPDRMLTKIVSQGTQEESSVNEEVRKLVNFSFLQPQTSKGLCICEQPVMENNHLTINTNEK